MKKTENLKINLEKVENKHLMYNDFKYQYIVIKNNKKELTKTIYSNLMFTNVWEALDVCDQKNYEIRDNKNNELYEIKVHYTKIRHPGALIC